jgi:hypothetical protein
MPATANAGATHRQNKGLYEFTYYVHVNNYGKCQDWNANLTAFCTARVDGTDLLGNIGIH